MSDNNDSSLGYTDESLKMLKTQEGQLNAVFACFGSAAQHAQLFEEGLAKFLIVYNKLSSENLTLEDFEVFQIGLKKKTMGALIRQLSQHVSFPDPEVGSYFDTALQKRNFLMHHFFLDRKDKFASQDGRISLLGELVEIEAEQERARVMINAMRIAMCETIGFKDDE